MLPRMRGEMHLAARITLPLLLGADDRQR
jgi:hypothetical protein